MVRLIALILAVLAVCVLTGTAAQRGPSQAATPTPAESMPRATDRDIGQATRRISAISAFTASTISPLTVLGGYGCWQYWTTAEDDRGGLPWHASPWVWGSAFVISACLLGRDWIIGQIPLARKPLDALEELARTPLGAVVLIAYLPDVTRALSGMLESAAADNGVATASVLAAPSEPGPLGTVFSLFVGATAVLGFVVKFLAGKSFDTLALLSPSSMLSNILHLLKQSLTVIVILTAVLGYFLQSSIPSLLLSLIFIAIGWFVAGWSLRLWVFGLVYSWDILGLPSRKSVEPGRPLLAFATGRLGRCPDRSLGRLVRKNDTLVFRYRPWLIMPKRTIRVETAPGRHSIGKGLLTPALMTCEDATAEKPKWTSIARFPPRYRKREEAMADALEVGSRDAGMRRGFIAAWGWLKDMWAGVFPARKAGTA